MENKSKQKIKKDRIFILVAALVTANLSYHLIKNIWGTIEGGWLTCIWCWVLIVANVIAIIGMLWLLQNYRRRRRVEKQSGNGRSQEG